MLIPLLLASAQAQAPLPALRHDELAAELRRIDGLYEHAALISIGRSRAGRALEGLRLGARADAPAILLVANLDGPRLFADALALGHARRLAEGYASDERVRALLDATTLYILPRANPDAAERCLDGLAGSAPRFEERLGGYGVDDDRDGRAGEDGPEDVNGDGLIAWMRYEDPEGTWILDPTDPRALIEADRAKGQRGRYKLAVEGRDRDGDERVAEDREHDARVNRNFPGGWKAYRPESGLFPTDEPEALALADFCVTHPEVALVVTYDERDDLVKAPDTVADDAPAVQRVPSPGILESDGKLLEELGRRYRELTHGEAAGAGDDGGTFQRFAYEERGLLTLDAVLWDVPLKDPPAAAKPEEEKSEAEKSEEGKAQEEQGAEAPAEGAPAAAGGAAAAEPKKEQEEEPPKPSDDAKRLAWIDAGGAEEAWRFLSWTPFEHPELGAVELGGFAPFARLLPPEKERARIADAEFEQLLTLGALLPRAKLATVTRESLGGGVWRIEAALENASYLPLLSRSALRAESVRPARLELVLPDAGKLLAGRPMELVSELPGSGGRFEATWLVQGPAEMEVGVRVDTDHAGDDTRKAEEAK